uniref:Uncharacterized protein n=1 Tax=viral metagenome TaxID=1070528 RepID=A0A6M3MB01_9ZZZZ
MFPSLFYLLKGFAMNGNSKCQYGINGCITTQGIKERVVKMEVQQENDINDIKALWKNLDAVKGLLFKFLIAYGVIFALIELGMKFLPIGN